MPRLLLSSCPAEFRDGRMTVMLSLVTGNDVIPAREAEIRTAADAQREFESFVAEVRAAGKPAYASARLAKGDRAPAGFRKLNLSQGVNPA